MGWSIEPLEKYTLSRPRTLEPLNEEGTPPRKMLVPGQRGCFLTNSERTGGNRGFLTIQQLARSLCNRDTGDSDARHLADGHLEQQVQHLIFPGEVVDDPDQHGRRPILELLA